MLAEDEKIKVKGFVDHLLEIPNIKKEPILIGEGLILNFIVQNMDQLKQTFKSPEYLPSQEWKNILQYILSDLYSRVSENALTVFNKFIETTNFDALNKEAGDSSLPNDFHTEKMLSLTEVIFKNKDARYNLNSTLNIFVNEAVEKYLTEIFKRRGALYNELVRVQKTNLECDEYIVFLKVMLILRNAAYLKIPVSSQSSTINIIDALKMPGKLDKYYDEAAIHFRKEAPNLSEKIIKLALKSILKNDHTNMEDSSSRLIFILASRFQNYQKVEIVDRGAESPDKSWFAISRKNADHYGFDKRMLDALYRIAGDNNW